MTRRKILLSILLDEFGGLKLDGFDDRLTLQKRIYLLQLFGVDLRYQYNWYVRGPYCPSLTEEAFELDRRKDETEKLSSAYELTQEAKKRLQEYRKFEKEMPSTDLPRFLELAASIHYLKHIGFLPGGVTKDNIKKKLLERGKGYFSDEQVNSAWGLLDKYELILNKMRS